MRSERCSDILRFITKIIAFTKPSATQLPQPIKLWREITRYLMIIEETARNLPVVRCSNTVIQLLAYL